MFRNSASWKIGQALGLSAILLVPACGGDDGGSRGGDDNNNTAGSGGSGGGSGGGGGAASTQCTMKASFGDENPVIYDGALVNGSCATSISPPRTGYWFGYNDGTSSAPPTSGAVAEGDDCAYHTKGSGFTDYGAGVGFSLNSVNSSDCLYDASNFTGMKLDLKGTATGTRGANYALTPNTVRVKLLQLHPDGFEYQGDDYGGWCTAESATDWTTCTIDFANAPREGYNSAVFDFNPAELIKIQFQFSKEEMAPNVEFDMYFDNIEFIP